MVYAVNLYARHGCNQVFRWLRQFPGVYKLVDFVTLALQSIVRLGWCHYCAGNLEACERPALPLELFDLHGCRYSRRVREALDYLCIEHTVFPCPIESLRQKGVFINSRFRPKLKALGDKVQLPFLVDPNKNVKIFESQAIIEYLFATYGANARISFRWRLLNDPFVDSVTSFLVDCLRPCIDHGVFRAASKQPERILELWASEGNPFSARVRETLCTLEIPYHCHPLPLGNHVGRTLFFKQHGGVDCQLRSCFGFLKLPFLYDPNTGSKIANSTNIVRYLQITYQTASVPAECWLDALPSAK